MFLFVSHDFTWGLEGNKRLWAWDQALLAEFFKYMGPTVQKQLKLGTITDKG